MSIIIDYKDIFSLSNIFNAYNECRKNKRNTINALKFEIKLLDNLCNLRNELRTYSYHPSQSICFIHNKPKLREIFAANFRDRIVHHLLVGYLEPVFEKIFIYDSYACRKNKGIHSAIKKLKIFINKATLNGTTKAWYLKEDIRGFFMNIDKNILYQLICKKIKRKDILWLAKNIIFHDCTKNYIFKGNKRKLLSIPSHKTLFKSEKNKGLPIGNLTSQFFANVYLNELDQFIKRKLKCKYYIRYCDDFIILSNNKEDLKIKHEKIKNFLKERLLLDLKERYINSISSGIDFLGYIVRRDYTLVRKRVINNFKLKLIEYEKELSLKNNEEIIAWKYIEDKNEKLRAITASYFGHFLWANSFKLKGKLFEKYKILNANFIKNAKFNIVDTRFIKVDSKISIRKQWRKIRDKFNFGEKCIILIKVGNFYESYNNDALILNKILNLKLLKGFRGFKYAAGFYKKLLNKYLKEIRKKGYNVLLVVENHNNISIVRSPALLFKKMEV